ncbi:MAG: adenosylcobinamide-GDP ribazoletransferase [Chloroflexi bacterium]|nr:adenosylcobinamide-GDP ribazoletransferase [Chloroflexota bacterium]
MRLLAAFQFLTSLPFGTRRQFSQSEIGKSQAFFPLVGFFIGVVLVSLYYLFTLFLPVPVTDALLIVAIVLLTAGLHLDGFLDTCDGIAGGGTPEERWRIMRDSHAGGIGVVSVSVLILLKYVSLINIPGNDILAALLLMPVLGRWAISYSIFTFPYARQEGLGKVFKDNSGWRGMVVASIIAVVVAFLFAGLAGLAVMAVIWLFVIAVSFYMKRRFAGLTGDTYGAINELVEVLVLILMIVIIKYNWLQPIIVI